MKVFLSLLLGLLPALLVLCPEISRAMSTDKRPRDFGVSYRWQAGSMPPPYHFEYTITIEARGHGEVVMIPDYPAETVPRWTESFTLSGKELDKLYRVMVNNGLFLQKWRRLDRQPVGGSRQALTVTASGKRIVIEDRLVSTQETMAETMYSAVTSSVPKAIWDKLNAQRERYMQEHLRKRNESSPNDSVGSLFSASSCRSKSSAIRMDSGIGMLTRLMPSSEIR
jgi:hypothetical protein